jgi:hypothetical protein
MRTKLPLFPLFAVHLATAQSVSPSVISSYGGTATIGGVTIDHCAGEVAVTTLENEDARLTQGLLQQDPVRTRLNMRAFLQGPYTVGAGVMSDSLRELGLVPLSEPYTVLGLTQIGSGGEQTLPAVLAISGTNAVIDWVHVQLRDKDNSSIVVATRNALLQADGDIVNADGSSALLFAAPVDAYFISVHHRNHLGVMTLVAVALTTQATLVDITNGSTATYGTGAQAVAGTVLALWSGDVNADGTLKYTGTANDRDPILVAIGGTVPTNTITGYLSTDVNLDGTTKYTGTANDRDPILVNIGGTVPTVVRHAQLP